MAEGNYSLADVASVIGNGAGRREDDLLGFLLVIMLLGGGGNGFFGNRQNFATQDQVQQGFDNQNTMANQREILSAITNGTAQSVAATNQTFHDTMAYIGDKYAELDRDILGINSMVQQSIANENQCCCNTLRAIDGVKFDAAQNTAAINANMAAGFNSLREKLDQNKIEALQEQVRQLQLQQAVAGMVKYPQSATYAIGTPFAVNNAPYFPNGFCG